MAESLVGFGAQAFDSGSVAVNGGGLVEIVVVTLGGNKSNLALELLATGGDLTALSVEARAHEDADWVEIATHDDVAGDYVAQAEGTINPLAADGSALLTLAVAGLESVRVRGTGTNARVRGTAA